MSGQIEQLNKIQIRAEILTVISKLQTQQKNVDVNSTLKVLDGQEDKSSILDILLKEFSKANEQKALIISFLMVRLCKKEETEEKLWELLKSTKISDDT